MIDRDRHTERMELEVPYRLIITILVIAVIVGAVVSLMYSTPVYPRLPTGSVYGAEGFVPRNVSEGLRALPEAEELLSFLDRAAGGAGGAAAGTVLFGGCGG